MFGRRGRVAGVGRDAFGPAEFAHVNGDEDDKGQEGAGEEVVEAEFEKVEQL